MNTRKSSFLMKIKYLMASNSTFSDSVSTSQAFWIIDLNYEIINSKNDLNRSQRLIFATNFDSLAPFTYKKTPCMTYISFPRDFHFDLQLEIIHSKIDLQRSWISLITSLDSQAQLPIKRYPIRHIASFPSDLHPILK